MDRRAVLAALIAAVAGCGGGGGGGSSASAPAVAVTQAPTPAPLPASSSPPAPTPACVASSTTAAFAVQRAKLTHWFAGGITGKRIVLVGDSTSSQMGPVAGGGLPNLFDDFLAQYVTPPGGALFGATVGVLAATGDTLANYAAHDADFTSGTGLYATTHTAGELFVFSYGLNDARLGADVATLLVGLRKSVNAIRAAKPTADIVLRVPNPFLATDTGQHYVVPNGAAQAYSDTLRTAYLALENEWPNVAVYDAQALLFGTASVAAHGCMADQIHPSVDAYRLEFQQLVELLKP